MIAALFDFDGTLYTGHVWQDLVGHHWRAGQHRRWVAAYLVRNLLPLPLYKLGAQSEEAYFHAWSRTMGWLLRGWSVEEADRLFARLTEQEILPNLRQDILERLRQHQASGHLVALVSGTFAPWLEQIAHELGIGHAVGTQLEVRDGRYTGRVVPPVCQSGGKPQRVRIVGQKELTVDLVDLVRFRPLHVLLGEPVDPVLLDGDGILVRHTSITEPGHGPVLA